MDAEGYEQPTRENIVSFPPVRRHASSDLVTSFAKSTTSSKTHKLGTRSSFIVRDHAFPVLRSTNSLSIVDCGHGGQVKNRTNSEEDGLDECTFPLNLFQ